MILYIIHISCELCWRPERLSFVMFLKNYIYFVRTVAVKVLCREQQFTCLHMVFNTIIHFSKLYEVPDGSSDILQQMDESIVNGWLFFRYVVIGGKYHPGI